MDIRYQKNIKTKSDNEYHKQKNMSDNEYQNQKNMSDN